MSKKDWKKQLFRVKQIADQNFGRAEKSEVLSGDLQHLEKQVDAIKHVWQNTGKKLLACSQSKRKVPEATLSQSMFEASNELSNTESLTLLASMFEFCGHTEGQLAGLATSHCTNLESQVMTPIRNLLEEDIPNIHKLKKNLNRLVLDMDSAKSRYHSAKRENPHHKLDSLKEEMEDALQRVEQCRDQLSTAMFTFVSKETVYSNLLISFIQAQATYHQLALDSLQEVLPKMQEQLEHHNQVPVYGTSLEEHLRRTNRDIAMVLEDCIVTIMHCGLEEEGLFRIAGSSAKVKKLKASFDSGMVNMSEYIQDIHCVAGALKLYLRELPEPLMTFDLYDEWMEATHLQQDQRLQALWCVVDKLPKNNYDNLRFLIKFLSKLTEYSDFNKMTSSNIAIVIGPNLIWARGNDGPSVLTTSTMSVIVDALVTHADWFFPGDIDFGLGTVSEHSSPSGTLSSPPTDTSLPTAQALFQATAPATAAATPASTSTITAPPSVQALVVATVPRAVPGTANSANDMPTASPRPNRRGKKPAPLPPAIPDRPNLVIPADPVEPTTVNIIPAVNSIMETKPSIRDKPVTPDKPNLADNRPMLPNTTDDKSNISDKLLPLEIKAEFRPVMLDNKPNIPEKPDSPDNRNSLERPSLPPPPRPVSPTPSPTPLDNKAISPRLDRPSEPPPPRPAAEKPSRPEPPVSQELRRDSDDTPTKPPRPSAPPPPPRRGHGTRADKSSDNSLNIEIVPAPPERSESKGSVSESVYI